MAVAQQLWMWLAAAGRRAVGSLSRPEVWRPDLGLLWRGQGGPGVAAAGFSLAWVCGAVAFALGLYLLLTWRPTDGAVRGREDALV